ncbi:hypothetical protein EVA_10482 [gut metagenome]|uniref:Uncharacterized protein n=1 Tax=gut metagenome TaxID=749906 RepID=J9G2F7_9ZZZZ
MVKSPPLIRPACNNGSISRTNTKVRAEAISSAKSSILSSVANWLLMNCDSKEIMVVMENCSSGKMIIDEPDSSSRNSIFFLMT